MQALTYIRGDEDDDDDDDDDDDSGDDEQCIDIPPGPGLDLQWGRPLEGAAQMGWSGAQVFFSNCHQLVSFKIATGKISILDL